MKKLFSKSAIALTMAMVLMVSMVTSAFAASFSDINGHWAQNVIEKWAGKGFAYGYTGVDAGKFKPDQVVTRAEFCAFANRFFGYFGYSKDATDMSVKSTFSDVQVNTGKTGPGWFYHDVAVAKAVGYVSGRPDGKFHPNDVMTREELAYALGQLFGTNLIEQVGGVVGTVDNTVDTALGLVHLDGVVPDLKPIVAGLLNLGIIKGVLTSAGQLIFDPQGEVTRAQIIQVMDNIFVQFPQFLENGDLLKTAFGLVGGLTGTVLGTVGDVLGVVDAVTGGLLNGTIGSDGSGLNGVVGGVLGGVTGGGGGLLGGLGGGLLGGLGK